MSNEDRSWMYRRRGKDGFGISDEFEVGLNSFIGFASRQPSYMDGDKIRCPCKKKCKNRKYVSPTIAYHHIRENGFIDNYSKWLSHGELEKPVTPDIDPYHPEHDTMDIDMQFNDGMMNMVRDVAGPSFDRCFETSREEQPNPEAKKFYDTLSAASNELYDGCGTSMLSAVAQLRNVKAEKNLSEDAYSTAEVPYSNINEDINNESDNEPLPPNEDVPSILTALTGKVADEMCDCHGKTKLTISDDKKHFLGSTAPARSYRKLVVNRSTKFWPRWSLVEKNVKEGWWDEFQKEFCLPSYPIHVVRKTWDKIGALQYATAIYEAHKLWKNTGKKKDWMKEVIFQQFVELWKTDQFVKRSEQAIKNRSSNPYGEEMPGKHTGGTIPFAEHSARLKRVRGEVHPGHVYNVTHWKKGCKSNELGAWVNVKSGQIYSHYTSLVGSQASEASTSTSSNTHAELPDENLQDIPPENIPWCGKHWSAAVGGVKRGHRVYGFGEDVSKLVAGASPDNIKKGSSLHGPSPSSHPMTRDDALHTMQANPIFSDIIAETVAGKVSEAVAEVSQKVSETIDDKLMDLVRRIVVATGDTPTTTEMLVGALRQVQGHNGTSCETSPFSPPSS